MHLIPTKSCTSSTLRFSLKCFYAIMLLSEFRILVFDHECKFECELVVLTNGLWLFVVDSQQTDLLANGLWFVKKNVCKSNSFSYIFFTNGRTVCCFFKMFFAKNTVNDGRMTIKNAMNTLAASIQMNLNAITPLFYPSFIAIRISHRDQKHQEHQNFVFLHRSHHRE